MEEKRKLIKVEYLRKFGRNIFNLRKLFWSLMYHSYDLSNLSLGIFNPHSYSVCIGDLSQQVPGCQSTGLNFFTKASQVYQFWMSEQKPFTGEKSNHYLYLFTRLKRKFQVRTGIFSRNSFLLMFDVSDFERLLSPKYLSSFQNVVSISYRIFIIS